jgi:hypothetical protein
VCPDHRKAREYFIGYGQKHSTGLLTFSSTTAANVKDASWCGVCEVEDAETY